jgi:hypothetical protein
VAGAPLPQVGVAGSKGKPSIAVGYRATVALDPGQEPKLKKLGLEGWAMHGSASPGR